MKIIINILLISLLITLVACASSPTGRRQLYIFPETQMSQMGIAAFDDMKQRQTISNNRRQNNYVKCIADAIVRELPANMKAKAWETRIFIDDKPNAFALPGGRIGVHTGMLKLASDANQLAAVIGHEVGHVWAKHGNERMSQQHLTKTGLDLVATLAGEPTKEKEMAMQLLGVGAQFGILLPFSRTHETESDEIGLNLMAQAGFDPRASVTLWQNMAKASNGQTLEFMSTHPSHDSRISHLTQKMEGALQVYQQARRAGKNPNCRS